MNKNNRITRWLSMLLLMMLASVGTAFGQSLDLDDFTIAAGQEKDVTISLVPLQDQTIYGFQADITASDGLTITKAVSAQDGQTAYHSATRVLQFSSSGASIAAGAAVTLTVKASDTFTRGDIQISNMRFTVDNTTGEEVTSNGVATATVTLEQAAGWQWRDFAINLTDGTIFATDVNSFGVNVADDGTYSATTTTDAAANVVVSAVRYNDKQHGWVNCTFTMKVNGPVLIKLGDCQWGDQNGTITDSNGNVTEIKANSTKGCWSPNAPDQNVVATYYRGLEPTELTIQYKGYCPFISATAIDPADLPEEKTQYTVTFQASHDNLEGTVPTALTVDEGTSITMPRNTTLYVEGSTLTGWNYEGGTLVPGDGDSQMTVNSDVTLTAVFTENEDFGEITEPYTLTWLFGKGNGVGTLNAQGNKTILVTQVTINNKTYDVKMDIDATNGKINNVGRGDKWAQCNDGPILTIPATNGVTVSYESYSDGTGTTIGGQAAANKAEVTYEGDAETLDIVAQGMGYISSVTATYPVPTIPEVTHTWDFTKWSEATVANLKADAAASKTEGWSDVEKANDAAAGNDPSEAAKDNCFWSVATPNADGELEANGVVIDELKGLVWDATYSAARSLAIAVNYPETTLGQYAGPAYLWLGGGNKTYPCFTIKNVKVGSQLTITAESHKPSDQRGVQLKINGENFEDAFKPTTLAVQGWTIAGDNITTETVDIEVYNTSGCHIYYIDAEIVEPQVAAETTVTFDVANAQAEGVAPAAQTVATGEAVTIPKNFTLYKQGYTLTAWTDGTTEYKPGESVTTAGQPITLLPVFTVNAANLADRQSEVTVKFDFMRQDGAPTVAWENQSGLIWVTQAEVNGKTIDVKADLSTNPGKMANGNWNDWAQLNSGTTFTIPSAKGAVVSLESFNVTTTTTIDGQTDYTATGKVVSYQIASSAETIDIVIGDGSYFRYIQTVLPAATTPGGEMFDNVAGTITWPVGNEPQGTVSTDIQSAVQNATWAAGTEMTVSTATYFEKTMTKYRPTNSNAGAVDGVMIEYRVKMAPGLTFTPSSVSYDAVKVGTDGATFSWAFAKEDVAETATQVDAGSVLRNNGSNSASAQLNHTLDASAVGACNVFAIRFYISNTANNKDICIGNVVINGTVNGTVQAVEMYAFTAEASPQEGGSVNVYPASEQYEAGTELTLTATENFGYNFVNWTNADGVEVSTEAKFKYTVTADAVLTANFQQVNTYELALTVDGTNDYMVGINPAPTMVEGKMMYEEGTAVQLTANQYEGLVTFTNWSDGETNSSKTISMTGDTELTAYFAETDIIAGWDFYKSGNDGRKADFASADNEAAALSLTYPDGHTSGWLDKSTEAAGGYESFKGAATNWRNDVPVGTTWWQTKVNAADYTDINVQFQMLYNYNAYQTYNAEYSLDGENWTKFGSITMTGAKAPASFKEQLPAEANNQAELSLRLIADTSSAIDGTESANDGNTLAMFFITGTAKLVDDGVAPVLVSSVPETGATGASATGKIVLTFDERVKVVDGATATLGNVTLTPVVNGKTITFQYKGLEYSTEYTFSLPVNSVADLTDNFITSAISITFTTMVRPTVEKKLYDFVVPDDGTFKEGLVAAESRTNKSERFRIFVKKGSYVIPAGAKGYYDNNNNFFDYPDPRTYFNSPNVSIIGEDPEATSITNEMPNSLVDNPVAGGSSGANPVEGIRSSGVLYLQSGATDTYFQDIKLWSATADNTGRNVVVVDGGNRTIYKNVTLWAYQDTYVSDNARNNYYFEGGLLRGRTDFLCGSGDVFYNGVTLQMCEQGGYIAVPRDNVKYGYVFKDCTIKGEDKSVDGKFYLGRPWTEGAEVYFIDTKMEVVPSAIGWAEMSDGGCTRMAEYNSTTASGATVDLSGRAKKLGRVTPNPNNPVLTAEEALEIGDLHNMFGDWDPTLATEQAPIVTNVTLEGNTLKWKGSEYALLYAICLNGDVVAFTTDEEFDLSTLDAPAGARGRVAAASSYTVRAANEMGGLNEQSDAASVVDAISEIAPATADTLDGPAYNTAGQRVGNSYRGIVIKNGKKAVVK